VHLVKVDMVGLQAAQRRRHRLRDPAARTALVVRIVAHGAMHLGGQHNVLATAFSALPTISSDSPLLHLGLHYLAAIGHTMVGTWVASWTAMQLARVDFEIILPSPESIGHSQYTVINKRQLRRGNRGILQPLAW
jgi:hypothetical protein